MRGQSREVEQEFERVLRRMAAAPVPEGLEARVQARLQAQLKAESQGAAEPGEGVGRRWTLWATGRLRWTAGLALAAAVVMLVVLVGGGWKVYEMRRGQTAGSVPRVVAPGGISSPERASGVAPGTDVATRPGGFRTADAVRVPPTLKPLHVAPAPHRALTVKETAKGSATGQGAVVPPATQR